MTETGFKLIAKENIENEHICCAFSDKKCQEGYLAKKEMIKKRIDDGFHFLKLDERGKVFIEFIPAEYAWAPVDADGYIFIHCFWVSGKFKGQGHAKKLLEKCEEYAIKVKAKGIVAITSSKKMPFISDKMFFIFQGFEVCDSAAPYFELVVKKYNHQFPDPKFRSNAKSLKSKIKEGVEIVYSDLCPFNEYYSHYLSDHAKSKGLNVKLTKIDTLDKAKNVNCPTSNFSLFYNGKFVTQEILTTKKFDKVLCQ